MRPTFRKLEVKDIGNLQRLVAENVDGIEPGLKILDTRLLLGQAMIDLVGLDDRRSLVLVALDVSADEGLLLRVMDAYSWCLEYPDTVRRLYPMAQVSTGQPPRILFVVERFSDAFLRRVKQLSFLEVDCFEFRHLEVNGASVVYFDLVERLRKSAAVPIETAPAPIEPAPVPVTTRIEPVAPRVERAVRVEPAVPSVEPVTARVQPVAPREELVASRVERPTLMVGTRTAVEPAPVTPAPQTSVPEPAAAVAVAPAPELGALLVGAARVEAAAPVRETVVEPASALPGLQLEAIEATASWAVAGSPNGDAPERTPSLAPGAPGLPSTPAVEPVAAAPAEVVAASPSPVRIDPPVPEAIHLPEPVQMQPEPVVAAVSQTPPVWAKPQAQPSGRPYFFAQATKGPAPVEPNATVAPAPQPVAKPALEVDDRPELESLSFPKDGLSRQWLEFLSQLGATK